RPTSPAPSAGPSDRPGRRTMASSPGSSRGRGRRSRSDLDHSARAARVTPVTGAAFALRPHTSFRYNPSRSARPRAGTTWERAFMRMPWLWIFLAACLLAPPAHAGEGEKEAKSYQVPYRLTATKHVLVRAKINGKGPFHFILDTGAPALFVSTAICKK